MDNKKKGEHPAFPTEYEGGEYDEFGQPIIAHHKYYGMSKRLYIATAAMQGLLAGKYSANMVNSRTDFDIDGFPEPISICEQAFQFADELLKQEINSK
jgi:hypothetical protein